jgi:hypothetical protein
MPNLTHGRCPVGDLAAESEGCTVQPVPRHWIWIQVAIVIFVVAGMVIAIIRLA